jgi:hypothetical protein
MKRSIMFAVMVAALAACENVQDPTSVLTPTPQMASGAEEVVVTAIGKSSLNSILRAVNHPAKFAPAVSLNFGNDPVTGDQRVIMYNRGLNRTTGQGILVIQDLRTPSGTWHIDLSQNLLNRDGNKLNRNKTKVRVCKATNATDCRIIRLVW